MADYIVTLDSSTYDNAGSAELALTNAGAAITKTYKFPLTYGVTATTAQLAACAGVLRYEEKGVELVAESSGAVPSYDHLKTTSLDKNFQYYWHPLDTTHGAGQTVYLMDTGVDVGHQEFGAEPNVENLYNCENATGFVDSAGHGTAMASLVVGNSIGAAANATIQNVKMWDNANGNVTVGEIVDALDEVLTHHQANSPENPKIVLMPWTVTKNQLIDDKCNELLGQNLMLVAAAGNRGNSVDVDLYTPGGLDTITTVGAHDQFYEVTPFTQLPIKDYVDANTTPIIRKLVSNAAEIDIFAIGQDVSVADQSNVSNYVSTTGTSPAAAMTAAVATHFLNIYSNVTAETIKSYMVSRGHARAQLPRRKTSAAAGHHVPFLQYANTSFTSGKTGHWEKISHSILSCPMSSQVSFTTIPSGRLFNIQYGSAANVDLGVDSSAVNVNVLDFSPLAPWMSLDGGVLTADTSNVTLAPDSIKPGIYHFALKGTLANVVYVEEYSIGVYENSESELNSSQEFYYDDDEQTYEEVVTYSSSFCTQVFGLK